MMVWKMIFLFNWVIFRFHVILPGCISPSYRTPCGGWLQYQYIFSCGSLKTKKHGARFLVPMAFLVGILCLLLCNFLHHQANTRKVALSTLNVYTNIYKYILYMYIYIYYDICIYLYIYICMCLFCFNFFQATRCNKFQSLATPGDQLVVLHHIIRHDDGKCLALLAKKKHAIFKEGCKGCNNMWMFPKMVVPPKHLKMVIFSRKIMVVGYHHCRKPPYVMCMNNKFQQTCITNDKLLETNTSPLKIGPGGH